MYLYDTRLPLPHVFRSPRRRAYGSLYAASYIKIYTYICVVIPPYTHTFSPVSLSVYLWCIQLWSAYLPVYLWSICLSTWRSVNIYDYPSYDRPCAFRLVSTSNLRRRNVSGWLPSSPQGESLLVTAGSTTSQQLSYSLLLPFAYKNFRSSSFFHMR